MKRDWVVVLATLTLGAAGFWFIIRPNLVSFKSHGGGGRRALSDIQNIETALTKILSDCGKSNLSDIFDPVAFDQATTAYMAAHNATLFEASSALYTRATYALVKHGRGALTVKAPWGDTLLESVQGTLDPALVGKLGTLYMSTLGDDPWGNPYQVYPGPWPAAMGPVLFRDYLPMPAVLHPGKPATMPPPDPLTVNTLGDAPRPQGFPTNGKQDVFIWSFGENDLSDQPRWDPSHTYAPPAQSHYREDAPDEYLGGGDDINNWDRDQTFMQHYF